MPLRHILWFFFNLLPNVPYTCSDTVIVCEEKNSSAAHSSDLIWVHHHILLKPSKDTTTFWQDVWFAVTKFFSFFADYSSSACTLTDLQLTLKVLMRAVDEKKACLLPTSPPPPPLSFRLLALAQKQICRLFFACKPIFFFSKSNWPRISFMTTLNQTALLKWQK